MNLTIRIIRRIGIGRQFSRADDARVAEICVWRLEKTVLTAFSGRILPLDEAAAVKAAQWHVPNPRPINAAYIAATAFTRRMKLVTRNIKDFKDMEVALVNPWDTPA